MSILIASLSEIVARNEHQAKQTAHIMTTIDPQIGLAWAIISKKFIVHPHRIKSREEITIWRWKILRSSTFLIQISRFYAETIDTRKQTRRARFSRSQMIFNVLISAHREQKLFDILSQVSLALCGIMAICQNLSFLLFLHECKHSDFVVRSHFCQKSKQHEAKDSLLQWRDQRNTQPWIWLQMVFPSHWLFVRTFFRVYSHVNYTARESWTKKVPTIATHDNRLEKLTNRHWNLANQTKKNDENWRFCRKTKYFLCLFFKKKKTPFPFAYFRLILISMDVALCAVDKTTEKKSKCMKQGQIWCAAQCWTKKTLTQNNSMGKGKTYVCLHFHRDRTHFIDLIFCLCLKSLWKAEKTVAVGFSFDCFEEWIHLSHDFTEMFVNKSH